MNTYETSLLTGQQADEFISKFDSSIGTETEVNKYDDGFVVTCFELTCFELTSNEVSKCRTIEKQIAKA